MLIDKSQIEIRIGNNKIDLGQEINMNNVNNWATDIELARVTRFTNLV
jgi:hypothetical protein